jgi:hypothetical protein
VRICDVRWNAGVLAGWSGSFSLPAAAGRRRISRRDAGVPNNNDHFVRDFARDARCAREESFAFVDEVLLRAAEASRGTGGEDDGGYAHA